jgi:hypothetical protein
MKLHKQMVSAKVRVDDREGGEGWVWEPLCVWMSLVWSPENNKQFFVLFLHCHFAQDLSSCQAGPGLAAYPVYLLTHPPPLLS